MKVKYLETPKQEWFIPLPKSKKFPRHWITLVDLEIELSDGYILKRPSGTIWDGASIPKIIWWLFKPIDNAAIGDFIHDELWIDKQAQFEFFEYNIYQARKFADEERLKWREALEPKKSLKNKITHFVIRVIGGFFYSQQLAILK